MWDQAMATSIDSVDEFLMVIESWRQDWGCELSIAPQSDPHYGIFRGQGNKSWLLRSKVARLPPAIQTIDRHVIEHRLFSAWKMRAAIYQQELAFSPNDDWEWLACAQHHGLATRLLDWTTEPLYALFFAYLHECRNEDSAVWGMKVDALPPLVPENVPMRDKPPLLDDTTDVWLYMPRRNLSTRLTAQHGCFTVQAQGLLDLPDALKQERRRPEQCALRRVIVPAVRKSSIANELRRRNVNYVSLFPGPDGLARTINREYSVEME